MGRCGHLKSYKRWSLNLIDVVIVTEHPLSGSERFSICLELSSDLEDVTSWAGKEGQLEGAKAHVEGWSSCFMFFLHHPNPGWIIRAVKGWGDDSSLNNPFMWSIQPQLPSSELHQMADVGWYRPYENTTFSVAKQQARHTALAMCRRDWHLSFHGWWFAAAQALETSKGCHGSCRWCAGAEPWYFFRRRWCGHLLDWFERIDLFMDGEYANKKRVGMTTIQTRRYTSWFPLAPHHIPGYFFILKLCI